MWFCSLSFKFVLPALSCFFCPLKASLRYRRAQKLSLPFVKKKVQKGPFFSVVWRDHASGPAYLPVQELKNSTSSEWAPVKLKITLLDFHCLHGSLQAFYFPSCRTTSRHRDNSFYRWVYIPVFWMSACSFITTIGNELTSRVPSDVILLVDVWFWTAVNCATLLHFPKRRCLKSFFLRGEDRLCL